MKLGLQIVRFGALGLLTFLLLVSIEKRHNHVLSGDEPHYLVMTHSLIQDHDLDLYNDYEEKRYLPYYPLTLDAHLSAGHQPKSFLASHAYSIHGPGMAFLLALPVWAFGTAGAVAFMDLVAILVLVLTYYWSLRVTGHRLVSAVAVITLASTIVFVGMFGRIYADLPIALLMLAAVMLASKKLTRATLVALGTVLGLATWLHFKTALIATPLGLWALYSVWNTPATRLNRGKKMAYLLIPWILLNLIFEIKLYQWFNVWIPSQIYPAAASLLQTSPATTLPAMAYDGTKGLLPYSPALWLVAAGVPLWLKRQSQTLLIAGLIVVPAIGLLATFSEWTGGYAPMGRYLIEFIPILMPAVGLLLLVPKARIVKFLTVGLLAMQLALASIWVKIGAPVFDLSQRNPLAQKIDQRFHFSIDAYAPHYNLTQRRSGGRYAALDIIMTVALLGYGVTLAKRSA